ncbi:phosphatase [Kribbella qitaiheensis]|uniref:Phosphatase n=1 Tax=Kribbella qitaiheensis TaxID=1544730 RepID=A0A7G6WVA5_9ACTN|nr:phosphatase [Kribbella qitaiheensis]
MSEQRGSDVDLAIAAAEAGAAVVRAKYGASVGRHDKSATDFATDADLAAEQAILNLIHQARPADAIVGEEYGASGDADAPRRWLVDPLCGTLNFAAQTPLFSVNVALQVDGEASVAAAADPMSGETFWTDGRTASVRRGGSDVPLTPSGRLAPRRRQPRPDNGRRLSRVETPDRRHVPEDLRSASPIDDVGRRLGSRRQARRLRDRRKPPRQRAFHSVLSPLQRRPAAPSPTSTEAPCTQAPA